MLLSQAHHHALGRHLYHVRQTVNTRYFGGAVRRQENDHGRPGITRCRIGCRRRLGAFWLRACLGDPAEKKRVKKIKKKDRVSRLEFLTKENKISIIRLLKREKIKSKAKGKHKQLRALLSGCQTLPSPAHALTTFSRGAALTNFVRLHFFLDASSRTLLKCSFYILLLFCPSPCSV